MLSAFLDSTNSKHLMLLDFIYVKFLLVLTTRINTLCRRRLRQQWMPCLQDLAKVVSWKTVLSQEEERWEKSRPILCNMGRHWGTRYLTVTVSVHFLSLNVQMRLYLEVPHSLKFAPVLICIIIFLAFRFNVISEDCMIAFICSSLILCSD